MDSDTGVAPVPVWVEWGRITRFLESARLAFARERNLWASLEIESAEDVKIYAPTGQGGYRVALGQHLAAIQDEDTLYASVLLHSYALVETAASDRLSADVRDFGGIEDWGARLLATNGATWDSVKEGVAGAVEVGVVRNAYAHGTRRIDQSAENRLRAVGMDQPSAGDPVTMDYAVLKNSRARLRSLLHAGGFSRARPSPPPPDASTPPAANLSS